MTNSKTLTEDAALKKEWRAGTQVYITALASDFVLSSTANTRTGKQTFDDVDVLGTLKVASTGDLDVNGKSNPQPNFADTAARDALYTLPMDGDKCTVAGTAQTYNGTTAQWESF